MAPWSRTRFAAFAITAIAISTCGAQAARIATPDEVQAEIRELGHLRFILRHFDDPMWSDGIILGVERAEPAWLEIAVALKPYADGAAGEELGIALFRALAVEPLVVLPVLQRVYGDTPEQLCTQEFEAELPKQGVASYLKSIERGLSKASTTSQRAMATSCSKGLEATRDLARKHGLK